MHPSRLIILNRLRYLCINTIDEYQRVIVMDPYYNFNHPECVSMHSTNVCILLTKNIRRLNNMFQIECIHRGTTRIELSVISIITSIMTCIITGPNYAVTLLGIRMLLRC